MFHPAQRDVNYRFASMLTCMNEYCVTSIVASILIPVSFFFFYLSEKNAFVLVSSALSSGKCGQLGKKEKEKIRFAIAHINIKGKKTYKVGLPRCNKNTRKKRKEILATTTTC